MFLPTQESCLPYRGAGLPPAAELDDMNIQHRIKSPVTALGRWWLLSSLVLFSGLALGVHAVYGIYSVSSDATRALGLDFTYVLAGAVAWAVVGWLLMIQSRTSDGSYRRLVFLPLLFCGVVVVGRIVYSPYGSLTFGLAVLYTTWLAYRIALHYAAWMAANPRVAPDEAKPYREFAREKGKLSLPVSFYWGWVFVLTAYAASVTVGARLAHNPYGPGLAVLVFAASLALTCVVLAVLTAREKVGFFLGVRLTRRAVTNFLFYNRVACDAPGTFQSPSGSARRRGWLLSAAVMAMGATVPSITAYFALVPMLRNSQTTTPQVVTYDKAKHDLLYPAGPSPDPLHPLPSLHLPGEVSLTPGEKLICDHLTTHQERAAYLHRIRYDRHAGLIPEEVPFHLPAPDEKIIVVSADNYVGRVVKGVAGGLFGGQAVPVLIFTAALFVSLVTPFLLLTLVTAVVGWPLFARYYRDLEAPNAVLVDAAVTPWEATVEAISQSSHQVPSRRAGDGMIAERDHLYLGTSETGEFPVLLHRSMLDAHFQVVGMSGGGKTALFIGPRTSELIRRKDVSVFIIDLKGEPLLFNTARLEAEKAGLPFRYFTNLKVPTHAFNPMTQSHLGEMNAEQRLQMLVRGMGLSYGDGFGPSYFGAANARMLRKLLKRYPDLKSFAHLMKHAEDEESYRGLTKKDVQDGGHMVSVLQALAGVPAINVAPGDGHPDEVIANAINLSDMLATPQVVYFYLKSDVDEDACRHIARLALFSMLTAAGLRGPGQTTKVHMILDEFQQIAGSQIKIVLSQARSRGLHCLLSHQSMSDLKTADGDFTKMVRDNTNGRVIFSTGDTDTLDEMVKFSGTALRSRAKWPQLVDDWLWGIHDPAAATKGEVMTDQVPEPRLAREALQNMSAEQTLAFVHLKKNAGYSWFGGVGFVARMSFPITRAEFEARNADVWPGGPGTFVPNFDDEPPAGLPAKLPTGPTRGPTAGKAQQPISSVEPPESADPGTTIDQLAGEPGLGSLPSRTKDAKPKPGRKSKPGKQRADQTQEGTP